MFSQTTEKISTETGEQKSMPTSNDSANAHSNPTDPNVLTGLSSLWSGLYSKIKPASKDNDDTLSTDEGYLARIGKIAKSGLKKISDGVSGVISAPFNWAFNKLKAKAIASINQDDVALLFKKVKSIIEDMSKGVSEGVAEEVTAKVNTSVNKVADEVHKKAQSIVDEFKSLSGSIIDTFVKTIKESIMLIFQAPFNWLLSILSSITNYFKSDDDKGKSNRSSTATVFASSPENTTSHGVQDQRYELPSADAIQSYNTSSCSGRFSASPTSAASRIEAGASIDSGLGRPTINR